MQTEADTFPVRTAEYSDIRRDTDQLMLSCVNDTWTPVKSVVGVMAVCQKKDWTDTDVFSAGPVTVTAMQGKIPGSHVELRFLMPWYDLNNNA